MSMKNNEEETVVSSEEKSSMIIDVKVLKSDEISYRPASKFFFIVSFILQVDLIINLYTDWKDPISRLLTLKEFLLSWNGLLGYVASNEAKAMLKYVRQHFDKYKINDDSTIEQIEIIKKRDKKVTKYNLVVSILLNYILHITCGLVPYLMILVSLWKSHKKGENFKNLPQILHLYFPKAFDSSLAFQLTYQTIIYAWYGLLLFYWSILGKGLFFSFSCLETEMELLCVEMERINDLNDCSDGTESQKLRIHLRRIVYEHQSICKNLENFGNVSSKPIIGIINLYGSQICIYLAFITLIDDLNIKLRYITRYLITFAFVYFAASSGQSITDLGRKLRQSFFECSWLDKPIWFRKTILFMNIRASKEMVVRPFRLYILDIGCIVTVFKGTYTYLNFAKKLID